MKLKITLEIILGKLPIAQIEGTIHKHIQPLTKMLPDKRMGSVIEVIILGILGGQTPVITGMARQNLKRGRRKLGNGQADLSIAGE